MFELVVTQAFGRYQVGDRITDTDEVNGVLAGPNRAFVVRTAAQPKPQEPPAPGQGSIDASHAAIDQVDAADHDAQV